MFNGKKVLAWLREKDMTKVELAFRLGISEGAVRAVLVGVRQPSLVIATKIARMMGVKLDDLIVELPDPEEA